MDGHILKVLEELREQNRTIITLLQQQLSCNMLMQIRILAIAGGDNVGQTTRRIMKKLISDSVVLAYNLRGKGSKQSFGAL